jgi:hypothetical protein
MTVLAMEPWVTAYFTGEIGAWDQRSAPESSIYFWCATAREGAYYEWERDGCGRDLPLPLGAIRCSGGGLRMKFSTLAEAKAFAESYDPDGGA